MKALVTHASALGAPWNRPASAGTATAPAEKDNGSASATRHTASTPQRGSRRRSSGDNKDMGDPDNKGN